MSEETTTEFRREGDPAFGEDTENEDSGDSSPEQTETEQTPAPEEDNTGAEEEENAGGEEKKPDSLMDHPRWKEREEDWKTRFNEQEERHTKSIQDLREEFEGKDKPKEESKPTKVPSWFGGDEAQWEAYQNDQRERDNRIREDTIKEMGSKSEAEQKAINEATQYFKDEVESIETDKAINPDGEKIDRNKLLKFVMDNDLVDSKGRWNYKAGYQLMKAKKVSTTEETLKKKKEVAGATTSEKGGEKKPSAFKTSEDFETNPQSRPW